MGIGALNYQGVKSGIKLNDVIQEFKYVYQGQEIKAGDFVEYINGVAGQTTQASSETVLGDAEKTGTAMSAVALDGNRVFIAHSYGSSYYLYGMVVTIDGVNIVAGADTQLSTASNSGYRVSACLLPNGNVFIAHSCESSYYLYGIVVTINEKTISKGSDISLSTTSRSGWTISSVLLPNGNVFIAHSYDSSYYLRGIVCSVSGTTISKGSDTSLSTNAKSGYVISTSVLANGNVFIAHSYGSDLYLYGLVCTISGTSITKGTDTSLVTSEDAGKSISTVLLKDGNVFVGHNYYPDSNTYYLIAIICTISGTSITAGTDTQLSTYPYTAYVISTVLLSNGKVFIAHTYDNYGPYYGMICSVNDTTIIAGVDTSLNRGSSGGPYDILLLQNGSIFAYYKFGSTDKLYAQIFGVNQTNNVPTTNVSIPVYEQQVTLATEPPFDGIALSNGVGGTATAHNQQVKISRPNV